jgi:cysteinyl-tRNA synthetase
LSERAQAAGIDARNLVWRAVLGLAAVLVMAVGGAWLMHAGIDPREEAVNQVSLQVRNPALLEVRRWMIVPPDADLAEVAHSQADLVVIGGGSTAVASIGDLKSLKTKTEGETRLVVARLPLAEIDETGAGWNAGWVEGAASAPSTPVYVPSLGTSPVQASVSAAPAKMPTTSAPSWLGPEQAQRRGTYSVRFWQPDWQARLAGNADASLDRILAAGFDGIYLTGASGHRTWSGERNNARLDMSRLIERNSAYARQRSPGFVIVLEDAEELIGSRRIRASVDALAKDGLLNSLDGSETPNNEPDIVAAVRRLKKAQREGLPVFALEALHSEPAIATARRRLTDLGFLPYFDGEAGHHPGP